MTRLTWIHVDEQTDGMNKLIPFLSLFSRVYQNYVRRRLRVIMRYKHLINRLYYTFDLGYNSNNIQLNRLLYIFNLFTLTSKYNKHQRPN